MRVKFPSRNLNPSSYLPHPTNTYTYDENKVLTFSLYYSTSTRPKSHILVENNPVRVNYAQLS